MPLPLKTDLLGRENALHLLRRATFGFEKSDVDRFATMTPSQAVEALFQGVESNGSTYDLPNPPLPIDPSTGVSWIDQPDTDRDENDLRGFFLRWLEGQMLSPDVAEDIRLPYSVRERIVFFFHTHFTTKQDKVQASRSLYYQNALFRFFAFDHLVPEGWVPEPITLPGNPSQQEIRDAETVTRQIEARIPENMNFKSLVEKICLDNAMLKFLDGNQNSKSNPNENFGREFLELYGIGRGLEGNNGLEGLPPDEYLNYTEKDVQEATRIFTGYRPDVDGADAYGILDELTGIPRALFNENRHDEESKTFSSRFDSAVIEGNEEEPDPEIRATQEIKDLVDLIFSKEETARHICRKVYRFYVHGIIDETIDNTVIAEMAQTFIESGFKLNSLLSELFQSTYFYEGSDSNGIKGSLIKSPMDLVGSTMSTLKISLPNSQANYEDFYAKMEEVRPWIQNMGMDFYEPFEVAGYSAYHQFPSYTRSWISTTYLTNRYDFIKQVVNNFDFLGFDVVTFIETNFEESVSSNAKALVIALSQLFFPLAENLTFDDTQPEGDLTLIRLNYFLSSLLEDVPSGAEGSEEAWVRYWGQRDPLIEGALQKLLGSILESPEYQLF